MFWVISIYFTIRNILPKSGTFLLGHPVYMEIGINTKYEHVIELCAKYLYYRNYKILLRVEIFTLRKNDTINNIEIKVYIYIYIYIYTKIYNKQNIKPY